MLSPALCTFALTRFMVFLKAAQVAKHANKYVYARLQSKANVGLGLSEVT